jgi:anti-anti-sigma regulatory factor/anti-sigma regulatory factor (Ser/Thr protein kinase)
MGSTPTPLHIPKLDSVTFDTLLERHNPFSSIDCTFDLTGVEFIAPSAAVQLAAACHGLAREGRRPLIVVNDEAVRTYLMRSGFIQVVQPVARFQPRIPALRAHVYDHLQGSNPMLIEVTKIQRGAELPALLDRMVHVLHYRLRYKKNDAFDVAIAISEVCQNSFDHNAHTCGFLAMQVYRSGCERFLEIGVADYGDGLATTLKRNPSNPPITSDMEAIRQATRLGISEFDDRTRGTGLYHLLDIAYKHRSSVQIRSGAATMRYRMDKQQGWGFRVEPMPGVQIALTLPTKVRA